MVPGKLIIHRQKRKTENRLFLTNIKINSKWFKDKHMG